MPTEFDIERNATVALVTVLSVSQNCKRGYSWSKTKAIIRSNDVANDNNNGYICKQRSYNVIITLNYSCFCETPCCHQVHVLQHNFT